MILDFEVRKSHSRTKGIIPEASMTQGLSRYRSSPIA
jgi:hypothetical protein